tara:strand:+ start:189 stop:1121 length:933 start_codon:yes stop_codon:yes gene_type:complete
MTEQITHKAHFTCEYTGDTWNEEKKSNSSFFDGLQLKYTWETADSIYLGKGTIFVGESACENWDIEDIEFPSTVKSIGKNAFSNCSKLMYISIPKTVESIGDFAFAHTSSCNTVVEARTLKYVGVFALSCPIKPNGIINNKEFIDIGTITHADEGNYHPFLNCYKRYAIRTISLPNGEEFDITYMYPPGKAIDETEPIYDDEGNFNPNHSGFLPTEPIIEIMDYYTALTYPIYVSFLDGEVREINGFFSGGADTNFQQLISEQHPDITAPWSIALPYMDYPVKELKPEDYLKNLALGNIKIDDMILLMWD